ncbi:OmpA family protein [bacterium]|nr:OmpA family protein [bacterium]
MKKVLGTVIVIVSVMLMQTPVVQAHPTYSGETGLFGILNSDTLDGGDYSFGFYLNNWDRELGDDKDAMDLDITTASGSFFYGITSRLEVGFQVNYLDLYSKEEGEDGSYNGDSYMNKVDESGFGDVHIGLKFNILNSLEKAVGLGVAAFAKLPTADDEKGLGTGETDYGLVLALTKTLAQMSVHANVGYTVMGEPDEVDDWQNVVNYGVGVNFPNDAHDSNFLQFIGELSGGQDPNPDLPDYLDLTMGVRYFFNKQFNADQPRYRNGWALSAGIRYNVMMEFDDCPIGGILGLSFVPPYLPPAPPPPAGPPKITGIEGLLDSIKACEVMDLKVNATDPDDDITEYRWSSSCGTIVGTGPAIKWEAPCPCTDDTPKSCTISVTVLDSKGQSDMYTHTVAIICPKTTVAEAPKPPAFDNVFFAPGSARVDNIAKAILDEIAQQLKSDSRLFVIIQGHTDNLGSENANMKMGLQRAENVKKYLVERHNIDASRLETLSFGSARPIGDNNTAEGRKMNRRVDFNVEIR